MKAPKTIFVVTILVSLMSTTTPSQADGGKGICQNTSDAKVGIRFCTQAIESGLYKGAQLAEIYTARAMRYRDLFDLEQGLADFAQALQLDATSPRAHLTYWERSHIYFLKGYADLSISDHNAALRLLPKDKEWKKKAAAIHSNRAQAYQLKGDFARALSDFNQAIKMEIEVGGYLSRVAGYTALRGSMWRQSGDLERALIDQNKAVKEGVEIIRYSGFESLAFSLRGDTLRYKGDYFRALADYDAALGYDPRYPRALTGKGLTLEKMGNLAAARAEFEKAVTTTNDFEAVETARSRLAALDSGAPQPVIAPAPVKAVKPNSVPSPVIAASRPKEAAKGAATHGRRIALIIGNSAYKTVGALANPQKDADVIATSLRNIGFEKVELVSDASREALVNALRAFAEEAERAEWAVVYYAGHGIEVNGINYLIPVDAKLAADRDVQFETVPLDQVMASVEGAKKLKVVILDACRDNPFAPQMRKTAAPDAVAQRGTGGGVIATRSIGRGLGEVKVSGATLVVYAAKHGQIALDGEGGNSPFAVALVQRIATPGVEINKIFRLIRDDVMEATAGRQEPFTYGSLPGREDFFFVAK